MGRPQQEPIQGREEPTKEGKEPQQEWRKGKKQEPKKKPQKSIIQEREPWQGQEQVEERPTQEEEQVSCPKRRGKQIPFKISIPLLKSGNDPQDPFFGVFITFVFLRSILKLQIKLQENWKAPKKY